MKYYRYAALMFPPMLCMTLFSEGVAETTAVPYAEVVFDEVWGTVNETFYDPNFAGLDWPAFREHYRAEVLKAETRSEMNTLLNEMLQALKHSHLRVIDDKSGIAGFEISSGIAAPNVEFALIEDEFFVAKSTHTSIMPVDKILSVDDVVVSDVFDSLAMAGFSPNASAFYAGIILQAAMSGDPGSKVEIKFERAGEAHKAQLQRVLRTDTEWLTLPGISAAQEVSYDLERVEDGIACIRFSLFAPAIMPKIRNFIQNIPQDSPGLIIDLRDNPGGIGLMAAGLLGMLLEENKPCGKMLLRSGELSFTAFAQSHAYLGKVAVLVNARSASTSEFFAAAVQDNQRGLVIGEKTSGLALASLFKPLVNGSSLQYVIANFQRANGSFIESIGVEPDIVAPRTHEDLKDRRDPAMEAAVAYILGE